MRTGHQPDDSLGWRHLAHHGAATSSTSSQPSSASIARTTGMHAGTRSASKRVTTGSAWKGGKTALRNASRTPSRRAAGPRSRGDRTGSARSTAAARRRPRRRGHPVGRAGVPARPGPARPQDRRLGRPCAARRAARQRARRSGGYAVEHPRRWGQASPSGGSGRRPARYGRDGSGSGSPARRRTGPRVRLEHRSNASARTARRYGRSPRRRSPQSLARLRSWPGEQHADDRRARGGSCPRRRHRGR